MVHSSEPKFKIAMIVDAFPVLSETFIVNQITGLLDSGHEVHIFASRKPDHPEQHSIIDKYNLLDRTHYFNESGSNSVANLALIIKELCSNLRWVSQRGIKSLAQIMLKDNGMWGKLALTRLMLANLSNGGYDIVHCQYGNLGKRVLPIVRNAIMDGKLVTAIRGHDVTQTELYTAEYYAELMEHGHQFMPVSDSLKSILIGFGCSEDKISVVRSGIDCAKFEFRERLQSLDEPMKLITVARLVEMKGLDYSINAVAQLIEQGLNLDYQIIGYGPLFDELNNLIESLGMQEHIRLRGALVHDVLVGELQQSDIFLAPSVTAANGEKEGIPNAVKEAMAQGMPVVATFHSGIPELVDHEVSGILVPERDTLALVSAISRLADNPNIWPSMGRQGRLKVEQHYDLAVVRDSLLGVYQRSLGN